MSFNQIKMLAIGITISAAFISGSAYAQKYKTKADTVKLNKEYGEISLDISKLNSKLIEAKNKTAGYGDKITSTAKDAVTAAQNSKDQAGLANNGDIKEVEKSLKMAKKSSSEANNAKDAMGDQADNEKKIADINEKITNKQKKLIELEKQKAAILAKV